MLKLKTLSLSICALLISACSNSQTNITRHGDGKLVDKHYVLESSDCLKLRGSFRLHIEQSKESSAIIKVDENLLPLIEVKTYSGCLIIQAKPGYIIKPSQPMEVVINTQSFSKLDASGNITFDARGLKTKNLDLSVSGKTMGHIQGQAEAMTLNASGSSSLYAANFQVNQLTINASGSSNLTVNAIDDLLVKAHGDVKITYKGKPSLTEQTSGSVKLIAWQNRKDNANIQPTLVETIVGK